MAAEIKVPDEVVEAAEDVRVRNLNAIAYYGSAGVDERHMMAMRAALEAGLAAMLEPVAVSREHNKSTPSFTDIVRNDSQDAEMWDYDLIPLYRIKEPK